MGEMCNVVKNTYGDEQGGFIGGQVIKFTGFVSEEGSFTKDQRSEDYVAILTYWRSFEQHEASHADHIFKARFDTVGGFCTDTYGDRLRNAMAGRAGGSAQAPGDKKDQEGGKENQGKSQKEVKDQAPLGQDSVIFLPI